MLQSLRPSVESHLVAMRAHPVPAQLLGLLLRIALRAVLPVLVEVIHAKPLAGHHGFSAMHAQATHHLPELISPLARHFFPSRIVAMLRKPVVDSLVILTLFPAAGIHSRVIFHVSKLPPAAHPSRRFFSVGLAQDSGGFLYVFFYIFPTLVFPYCYLKKVVVKTLIHNKNFRIAPTPQHRTVAVRHRTGSPPRHETPDPIHRTKSLSHHVTEQFFSHDDVEF